MAISKQVRRFVLLALHGMENLINKHITIKLNSWQSQCMYYMVLVLRSPSDAKSRKLWHCEVNE